MPADARLLNCAPRRLMQTFLPPWPVKLQTVSGCGFMTTRSRFLWRGTGHITGTVTVDGVAAVRNVYLHHRKTGTLLARTVSAADGTYRFDNLSTTEKFLVIATDADANVYNAAAADIVTPAG